MTIPRKLTVLELMNLSGVQFGTSGARGLVAAMTDRVCYSYTLGFLQYLASLGEFAAGTKVAISGDLRASTPRILAACAPGIRALGGEPVFCGYVPTPAVALYAMDRGIPSLMVTGSHIPDDRNGIKFYRARGEVLKDDEVGMSGQLLDIDPALFTPQGALVAQVPLPAAEDAGTDYVRRYVEFFGSQALSGMHVGVYQHSAVGRDILLAIITALGAKAEPLGRSDTFIPVDTEAVRPEDAALAAGWAATGGYDAIVSTDGDSDRPLLADHTGTWLRGDVLGVLCAAALKADCVVTPVSSNSVLEKSGLFARTARTRIGSPYVIAEMNAQLALGGSVCGYEANGGFLLASDFVRDGRVLSALPTRDAILPIIAALAAAHGRQLADLSADLPARVTHSDRIKDFPTANSQAVVAYLLAGDDAKRMARIGKWFGPVAGEPTVLDLTDGVRMEFASGVIIHLRPSGNAPELRCYTEADTAEVAADLNVAALALVRDGLARAVLGQ